MKRLIDELPGVSMSVGDVTRTLRHMWDVEGGGDDHRMDFRASQMNLILHFGLETTVGEAQAHFQTAIAFAQTYPSRIIVLCPAKETVGEDEFEGKLFSQCYIGQHLRDVCCCEALILGYSPEQSDFLENQVSLWLEADLPIYHWLHRVPADRISGFYLGFLKRCRKVLFDGAVEGEVYKSIEWPDSERVADLSHARTLPLRQHLGQFISRFSPSELADGLKALECRYCPGVERLAWHLMRWQRQSIRRCFAKPADADAVSCSLKPMGEDETEHCLCVTWTYDEPRRFLRMDYSRSRKSGRVRASLPSGSFEHPLHIEPLSPVETLGEAMFFD
ncbi:MAG: hypothetical protein R6V45_06770 [Oceanipulchritudo sp.]